MSSTIVFPEGPVIFGASKDVKEIIVDKESTCHLKTLFVLVKILTKLL